jgi:hypothetical protein
VLLAPQFRPAAISAALASPGARLQLAALRFVENGSGVSPLLEPIGSGDPAHGDRTATAGFRSGLSAEDLDLTPEERAEFEDRERF